ncbi:MAG: hypothetical protein V1726_08430 [Methanobacteriota archaeon]
MKNDQVEESLEEDNPEEMRMLCYPFSMHIPIVRGDDETWDAIQ